MKISERGKFCLRVAGMVGLWISRYLGRYPSPSWSRMCKYPWTQFVSHSCVSRFLNSTYPLDALILIPRNENKCLVFGQTSLWKKGMRILVIWLRQRSRTIRMARGPGEGSWLFCHFSHAALDGECREFWTIWRIWLFSDLLMFQPWMEMCCLPFQTDENH